MYKLLVSRIREGLHHTEVIVAIETEDGQVTMVVDKDSLDNDQLLIGYPLASRDGKQLVELPRETSNGLWRVWVASESLEKQGAAACEDIYYGL
jgi:hypothetical protein